MKLEMKQEQSCGNVRRSSELNVYSLGIHQDKGWTLALAEERMTNAPDMRGLQMCATSFWRERQCLKERQSKTAVGKA